MIAKGKFLSVLMLGAAVSLCVPFPSAVAQTLSAKVLAKAVPATRITGKIDPTVRVVLKGHVPAAIENATDLGQLDPSTPLSHMLMVLQSSSDQEHALRTLLDQQNDKSTANYHKWLSPTDFQNQFGVSSSDIATVTGWLQQQGFSIDQVMPGGRIVEFSGNVGNFETAFQTQFHRYQVGSVQHVSINSDISIPQALSPVIRAIPTVHDFFPKPQVVNPRTVQLKKTSQGLVAVPNFTSGSTHYVGANDFATIYNTTPLLNAGINGAGVTIGVVGRTDVSLNDVQAYRELFNLPTNNPNFIVAGSDPGVSPGDDVESDLDVEVSGGVAPGATVDFVTSKATLTVDGVDLSFMYIVQNNLTDIISESYGECEADLGTAGLAFDNTLREQASAQGISVFVSTGDSGPAGCDSSTSTYDTAGYAVSGDASTPYNVAVGGSEFDEGSGTYWSTSNPSGYATALSYIPEYPWNESKSNGYGYSGDASDLASGGGGISAYYNTPSWQRGYGVPTSDPAYQGYSTVADPSTPGVAGPHRYMPDVVLAAASDHDGTLFCTEGNCEVLSGNTGFDDAGVVGGTSVAAPSMAGVQALIDEANGGRQGLPTYQYYALSQTNYTAGLNCASNASGGPNAGCAFNDITAGNNLVCAEKSCTTNTYTDEIGWMAGPGFDLASGLGSPNVYALSSQWASVVFASSVTSLSIPTVGTTHGTPTTLTVTVAAGSGSGTPTGDVAFTTTTGAITTPENEDIGDFTNQGPLCTLSNGTCTIQLSSLPAGSTSVLARYAGDGTYGSSISAPVAVTIAAENSVTTLNANTLNCSKGSIIPATSFAYGSLIYLDGNVAGASGQGVATGTLSITDNGNPLTSQALNATGDVELVSGNPAGCSLVDGYSFTNLAPLTGGLHVLGASYAGDSNFNASTLSPNLTVTVTPAALTTALNSSATEISSGGSVNLVLTLTPLAAATLAAAPTGSVTFVDTTTSTTLGTVSIGTGLYANVSYSLASLTTTGLTTSGAHSITATYSGDANYASSSATGTVTVGGTGTINSIALTSTSTSFVLSTTNTVTATLTYSGAVPTGTVYFFDGATEIGSGKLSASAKATLATAKLLRAGAHSITATFGGSTTYPSATSAAALAITVTQATPTLTMTVLNTSTVGAPLAFTSAINTTSPTTALTDFPPTGGVEFFDGANAITGALPMTVVASEYDVYQTTTNLSTLAAGVHTITAELIDPNYTATPSYSQTVKVYAHPLGNLEKAVDAATGSSVVASTDSLFVGGWAADAVDGSTLASVNVYIDGKLVGPATTGISRPDVASYYNNPAYATSGYSFVYSAASLTAGLHAVTVVATDSGGYSTTFGPVNFSVNVVYPAPVGNLEQAIDATTSSTTVSQADSLFVSGWAADPTDGAPMSNVTVYIDGNSVGKPTLGIARPDVAAAYNNNAYLNSGYQLTYAASNLSPGNHSVTVIAINSHGVSTTFGPLTIAVTAANRPPVGNLELAVDNVSGTQPVLQTDSLFLSGWAADYQSNGPAQSVQVLIDGNAVGNATLGIARPDVEAAYPSQNWLDSGYQYVTPASGLSVGSHQVTVIATDSLGLTTTFGPLVINVQP